MEPPANGKPDPTGSDATALDVESPTVPSPNPAPTDPDPSDPTDAPDTPDPSGQPINWGVFIASALIIAVVTAGAVAEMGIAVGQELWCAIKAVEVRIVPRRAGSADGPGAGGGTATATSGRAER